MLDDAEQPKDEDQDQQTAKTDIHVIPPVFVLRLKRASGPRRSSRYAHVPDLRGIILPVWKRPDLLDFSTRRRK